MAMKVDFTLGHMFISDIQLYPIQIKTASFPQSGRLVLSSGQYS